MHSPPQHKDWNQSENFSSSSVKSGKTHLSVTPKIRNSSEGENIQENMVLIHIKRSVKPVAIGKYA